MSLIACRTTAPGRGAVAVVEVIGSRASLLVGPLFSRSLPVPGRAAVGRLGGREPVDEVVVRVVPPGESFTGEETVEVHCHGGEAVVAQVLSALEAGGARVAGAREILARARANGRIDRIQEEAYERLPHAWTELAARVLLDQAHGALSRAVREGRDVLATAPLGVALASPRRLVLAGRPNAGKSTLFNRIVACDRVLVSEGGGTTRDPVRERVAIEGVPFLLSDTAGIAEGGKPGLLETLSMERARREIGAADLLIFLHDASAGVLPEEERFLERAGRPVLRVANKTDLGDRGPRLRLCARTGEGLDSLRAAILGALGIVPRHEPGAPVVFTERQEKLLAAGRRGDVFG